MRSTFLLVDSKHRGFFDVQDLFLYLRDNLVIETVTLGQAEESFRRLDLNNKGKVSVIEWDYVLQPFALRRLNR